MSNQQGWDPPYCAQGSIFNSTNQPPSLMDFNYEVPPPEQMALQSVPMPYYLQIAQIIYCDGFRELVYRPIYSPNPGLPQAPYVPFASPLTDYDPRGWLPGPPNPFMDGQQQLPPAPGPPYPLSAQQGNTQQSSSLPPPVYYQMAHQPELPPNPPLETRDDSRFLYIGGSTYKYEDKTKEELEKQLTDMINKFDIKINSAIGAKQKCQEYLAKVKDGRIRAHKQSVPAVTAATFVSTPNHGQIQAPLSGGGNNNMSNRSRGQSLPAVRAPTYVHALNHGRNQISSSGRTNTKVSNRSYQQSTPLMGNSSSVPAHSNSRNQAPSSSYTKNNLSNRPHRQIGSAIATFSSGLAHDNDRYQIGHRRGAKNNASKRLHKQNRTAVRGSASGSAPNHGRIQVDVASSGDAKTKESDRAQKQSVPVVTSASSTPASAEKVDTVHDNRKEQTEKALVNTSSSSNQVKSAPPVTAQIEEATSKLIPVDNQRSVLNKTPDTKRLERKEAVPEDGSPRKLNRDLRGVLTESKSNVPNGTILAISTPTIEQGHNGLEVPELTNEREREPSPDKESQEDPSEEIEVYESEEENNGGNALKTVIENQVIGDNAPLQEEKKIGMSAVEDEANDQEEGKSTLEPSSAQSHPTTFEDSLKYDDAQTTDKEISPQSVTSSVEDEEDESTLEAIPEQSQPTTFEAPPNQAKCNQKKKKTPKSNPVNAKKLTPEEEAEHVKVKIDETKLAFYVKSQDVERHPSLLESNGFREKYVISDLIHAITISFDKGEPTLSVIEARKYLKTLRRKTWKGTEEYTFLDLVAKQVRHRIILQDLTYLKLHQEVTVDAYKKDVFQNMEFSCLKNIAAYLTRQYRHRNKNENIEGDVQSEIEKEIMEAWAASKENWVREPFPEDPYIVQKLREHEKKSSQRGKSSFESAEFLIVYEKLTACADDRYKSVLDFDIHYFSTVNDDKKVASYIQMFTQIELPNEKVESQVVDDNVPKTDKEGGVMPSVEDEANDQKEDKSALEKSSAQSQPTTSKAPSEHDDTPSPDKDITPEIVVSSVGNEGSEHKVGRSTLKALPEQSQPTPSEAEAPSNRETSKSTKNKKNEETQQKPVDKDEWLKRSMYEVMLEFYLKYHTKLRLVKKDKLKVFSFVVDSCTAWIQSGTYVENKPESKAYLMKLKNNVSADSNLGIFLELLDNRMADYETTILQDLAFLKKNKGIFKTNEYMDAVLQIMGKQCTRNIIQYVLRQDGLRKKDSRIEENCSQSEIEKEIMEALEAENENLECETFYNNPYVVNRMNDHKARMKFSFNSTHFVIFYEILKKIKLECLHRVLDYDFHYLSTKNDAQKDANYIQMFTNIELREE